MALACFGNLALALVSGGVLTLAKLGSAAAPSGSGGRLCRMAVLASRVPALAALGLQLAGSVEIGRTGAALWVPVVMLICNLLWVRADYLLLRDAPATGAGR